MGHNAFTKVCRHRMNMGLWLGFEPRQRFSPSENRKSDHFAREAVRPPAPCAQDRAFRWNENVTRIEPTHYFDVKTEHSNAVEDAVQQIYPPRFCSLSASR